jgi:hypothetical protein
MSDTKQKLDDLLEHNFILQPEYDERLARLELVNDQASPSGDDDDDTNNTADAESRRSVLQMTEEELESLAEVLDEDFKLEKNENEDDNNDNVDDDGDDDSNDDDDDDDDDDEGEQFDEYFCDCCDAVPKTKMLICSESGCDFVSCTASKCKKNDKVANHEHGKLHEIGVFTDYYYLNENNERVFHVSGIVGNFRRICLTITSGCFERNSFLQRLYKFQS